LLATLEDLGENESRGDAVLTSHVSIDWSPGLPGERIGTITVVTGSTVRYYVIFTYCTAVCDPRVHHHIEYSRYTIQGVFSVVRGARQRRGVVSYSSTLLGIRATLC
jgi:hypothetical protein